MLVEVVAPLAATAMASSTTTTSTTTPPPTTTTSTTTDATNDDRHIHDDCGTVYLLDVDDTSHVVHDHIDDVNRDVGGLGGGRGDSPVGH